MKVDQILGDIITLGSFPIGCLLLFVIIMFIFVSLLSIIMARLF